MNHLIVKDINFSLTVKSCIACGHGPTLRCKAGTGRWGMVKDMAINKQHTFEWKLKCINPECRWEAGTKGVYLRNTGVFNPEKIGEKFQLMSDWWNGTPYDLSLWRINLTFEEYHKMLNCSVDVFKWRHKYD